MGSTILGGYTDIVLCSDTPTRISRKTYCGGQSMIESKYGGGGSKSADGAIAPASSSSSARLHETERCGGPGCW